METMFQENKTEKQEGRFSSIFDNVWLLFYLLVVVFAAFGKMTPANRLALSSLCVRDLRAAALTNKNK